jgi:dolichol-phosphate mannosyltransferase
LKTVVCLPTYNERENVERMVRALADYDVLVIDDRSPDSSAAMIAGRSA